MLSAEIIGVLRYDHAEAYKEFSLMTLFVFSTVY